MKRAGPHLREGFARFLWLARTEGAGRAIARGILFLTRKVPTRGTAAPTPREPLALTAGPSPYSANPASGEIPGPSVSTGFVVRVISSDPAALERTIQSILRQTEPTWEIWLSVADGVQADTQDWTQFDERIHRLSEPPGDRNDLTVAASHAASTFLGSVAQGDLVDEDLVRDVAQKARIHPDVDVIYTDEARILDDGRIGDYFYKPDWSPEHLYSANYIGGFVAFRKAVLLDAAVESTASVEASDYALLLEVTRRAAKVAHIDEALYFSANAARRRVGGFFSSDAFGEARRILQDHVQREHRRATVTEGMIAGALHVQWPTDPKTPVTLVILTGMRRREMPGRGNIVLATHFVRSIIERSTFPGYRILVVDDGEVPDDLRALLAQHGHERCSYRGKGAFSFAKKANFGVGLVEKGVVILLNDDMEVIDPGWIEALVGLASRPEIGVAGARLLHIDGGIQHAGVAIGYHGEAGHTFHRAAADGGEYGGFASIVRNFSAVTGATMAFRKSVFDALGGLDEQFSVDYNDIDFCLRAVRMGLRVAVTPAATLYHFHNSSLQRRHADRGERRAFVTRWAGEIERDPYFSKHFQKLNHELPLLIGDVEPLATSLKFDCGPADLGSETTYRRLVAHIEQRAARAVADRRDPWSRIGRGAVLKDHRPHDQVIAILESGLFDAEFYLSMNKDIAAKGADPLWHYVRHGDVEGRWPNGSFDPIFYRRQFAGDDRWPFASLFHYATTGERAGFQPCPNFRSDRYLTRNEELGPWIQRPLAHFLWIGRHHGLSSNRGVRAPIARMGAVASEAR